MARKATRLAYHRGAPVTIMVDGAAVDCFAGETVAAALLAAGVPAFSYRHEQPRVPFCGMGTCFECGVTVDGVQLVRACLTPVVEGMVVETGRP